MNGFTGQNAKLIINIKDNASALAQNATGINKNYEITTVDNSAPSIGFSNLTSGTQQYGSSSVTLRGTTSDGNLVTKVEYALTKTASVPANDSTSWKTITYEGEGDTKTSYTGSLSWQITFDGNTSTIDTTSYHADLLRKSLFELYTEIPSEQQASYDENKNIYIWIRATDELGNTSVNDTAFYLSIIPNGDRPAIEITYPANGASVGGTVRITGTTDIADTNTTVKAVYIQIDPDYRGTFNTNWAEALGNLVEGKTPGYSIVTLTNTTDENNVEFKLGDKIGSAIAVRGSVASWNLPINAIKEFNGQVYELDEEGNRIPDDDPENTDGYKKQNRKIGIKAFAVGSTGKITESEVYSFTIDANAPIFGSTDNELRFVQYETELVNGEEVETSTIKASRKFENGINLKGLWYLIGAVHDVSGIYTINYTKKVGTNNSVTENLVEQGTKNDTTKVTANSIATPDKPTGTDYKNYDLKIPIGDNSSGHFGVIHYEIAVEDGGNQIGNSLEFDISYDNKEPSFEVKTGNGKDLSVAENRVIRQSNGKYTVVGTFSEIGSTEGNQSGFERIAMFFTRERTVIENETSVEKLYLIDPIVDDENGGNTTGDGNFFELGTYSGTGNSRTLNLLKDEDNHALIVEKEGLYWRTAKATLANTNELTVVDDTMPENVRAGGLCMVDNVIYRIRSITGNTIILEGALTDITTAKEVYFALAQIIDHQLEESINDEDGTISNDDDDGMVESVSVTGSTCIWSASFDSSNMLDGNVKMNFVAYDKAGNYIQTSQEHKIQNNSPRIAGVSFGADNDLNNTVDDTEMFTDKRSVYVNQLNNKDRKRYNGQDSDGKWITEYNPLPYDIKANDGSVLSTMARLVVKGAIKVRPEIVGGNGGLGWSYSSKTGETVLIEETTAKSYDNVGHSSDGSVRTKDLSINISLKDFLTIENLTAGNQDLIFKIWDKTDGSTLGDESTGSAYAKVTLPVDIKIADEEAPDVKIDPFYWVSKDNNSLYMNKQEYGHIELEKDLPTAFFTIGGFGIFDTDAKVSGKVTFEATATDNVVVNEIWAKIDGYNLNAESEAQLFKIAQRGSTGWESMLDWDSETESRTSHLGSSLVGENATDWSFEIAKDENGNDVDLYDSETGENTVKFKFHFNTEKITSVAMANVGVSFKVYDKGSPTLINGNVDYPDNTKKDSKLSVDAEGTPTDENPVCTGKNATTGAIDTSDNAKTGYYKIDVVPYIAKVYSSLAKLKKNNWSVYNRTARGHYSVASNETIYLYGFNLGNDYYDANNAHPYRPRYGTTELTAPVNGSTANANYPSGSDYANYQVVNFPVTNVTSSGEISITVNGVETLNNKNGNDSKGSSSEDIDLEDKPTGDKDVYNNYYYNRQPNGDNNNLLTDDVVLDVWEINSEAAKPKNGSLSQPVMSINPINNKIEFAFVNGSLFFSMGSGVDKNKRSYEYWIGGIDFWTNVEFVHDSFGHTFATVTGGDINEGKADQFRIFSSRWGNATRKYTGYNDGTNQLRLEMIAQRDFLDSEEGENTANAVLGYNNFDKQRIHSPSITTTATNTNTTNVYLAYYDEINDEIRFRRGIFKDTKNNSKNGLFDDYMGLGSDQNSKVVNSAFGTYGLENVSLIAGQTTDKLTAKEYKTKSLGDYKSTFTEIYKETNKVIATDGTPIYAGNYVDIAAISQGGDNDDAVIAVWWDSHNKQLLYSYNLKPNSIAAGSYLQEDTNWTKPVSIFGEDSGIGEYCKVAVIEEGLGENKHYSAHVVAYDRFNGDVCYAYLSDFKSPANAKTCVVDTYGIIGTEMNIDVVLSDDNKAIPYISYYAGSIVRPKMAYLLRPDNLTGDNLLDNTKLDAFTGIWEISIIPTSSMIPEDHINIGLWKKNGKINYSTKDGNIPNTEGTNIGVVEHTPGIGETANSYGQVYGNGSENPVIGYAITSGVNGFIETAQMK